MPGPIHVHLVPRLVDPAALRGGIAVVIDQLRASTTICTALAAGAVSVIPCLEPDEALKVRATRPPGSCLTGGERGGLLIPGFDLDNSPRNYTAQNVRGRSIAFTTTNGTRAVALAAQADAILIGCLANLGAIAASIGADERPVHLLCAGTRDRLTLEDVLCAGALADGLARLGRPLNLPDPREDDDSAQLARSLWLSAQSRQGGIAEVLRASRGGRNLARIGLAADIELCSRVDTLTVVPTWDPAAAAFAPG